jgi:hypothetical protein
MTDPSLVVGVLDTSRTAEYPDLASKLRDFTLSYCRFDYSGPIFESVSIEEILNQAAERGHRYIAVQEHGHVMTRYQDAQNGIDTNFLKAAAAWVAEHDFLVAGWPPECFLVDLERYRRLGRPAFSSLTGRAVPLDDVFQRCRFDLRPRGPEDAETFRTYRGAGIFRYDGSAQGAISPHWKAFLDGVQDQAKHAKRGVFPVNFESYRDIEEPPQGFQGPVSSVYGVAAGFKVNRILETHGFDERTRVVFFDYSPLALDFKRMLVAEWDGVDYPAFVQRVAGRVPDAFYQLWNNPRPGTLNLDLVATLWERELGIWGGAQAFERHWSKVRQLPHRFVHCDLFADPKPLLGEVRPGPRAVMWWSNAFHSINSLWFYDRDQRIEIYHRWLRDLAAICPDLLLYGNDVENLGLGGIHLQDHLAARQVSP